MLLDRRKINTLVLYAIVITVDAYGRQGKQQQQDCLGNPAQPGGRFHAVRV